LEPAIEMQPWRIEVTQASAPSPRIELRYAIARPRIT
jgi:hypothetical protein